MVAFGARLRMLRQARGLTQKQLADQLGLTKSVVSAYETDLRMPSYDVLIKISAIFGATTDELLGIGKREMIDVSGLSAADKQLILNLVNRLRNGISSDPV